MMPWDWIGIVTIRSDTRRSTSITGMIRLSPGARGPRSWPSRNSTPCSYCLTIRTDSPNPSSASSTTMTTTAIKTPTAALHSLTCGELGRQDDLGDPGQRARHRADPLGRLRVRLQLLLTHARDASLRIQVAARHGRGAAAVAPMA